MKKYLSTLLQSYKYGFRIGGRVVKGGLLGLSIAALQFGGLNLTFQSSAVSAACANTPDPSLGTVTQSITAATAGTYRVWSRIMAPDTTNNSYYLQVDGGCAINVGDSSSIPANTWTWVNYQDGNTASYVDVTLSQGTHTLLMTGRESGVMLDRVIFTGDTSCVPTGTGDNCANPDTTPPTVSVATPSIGSTVSGSTSIQVNATDASGISKVDIMVDGTILASPTTSPYTATWDTTKVADGTHYVSAKAYDTAGNTAPSSNVTVTVQNSTSTTDTQAPTQPTNVTASAPTSAQVQLSWTASTDNVAVTGYKIYRGGTLYKTVTTTSYTDTAVTANTDYTYQISAIDAAGNESTKASTTPTPIHTPAATDTTAPTAPTSLHATVTTSNTVSLAWTASTDNVGVKGYHVYRNGTLIGDSTTTSYTDSNLTSSTTYTYTVKAFDASANLSAASNSLNVTTLAGTSVTGDVNGDGHVNLTDLAILFGHWGSTTATTTTGDVNGDGKVDLTDLAMLFGNWGK